MAHGQARVSDWSLTAIKGRPQSPVGICLYPPTAATMKIAIVAVFACLLAAATADNLVQLATKLGANTLVKLVTDAGLAGTLSTGGKALETLNMF